MIWLACVAARARAYDPTMRRICVLALVTACWTSSPPPPRTPAWQEPATAVVPRPVSAWAPCDPDPDNDEDGIGELACAREEFARRNYADADMRAQIVMKNFPYSKIAAGADELHADILVVHGDYDEAEAAYTQWLDKHRWTDEVDIERVRQKQLDAHERAR